MLFTRLLFFGFKAKSTLRGPTQNNDFECSLGSIEARSKPLSPLVSKMYFLNDVKLWVERVYTRGLKLAARGPIEARGIR